MTKFWRVLKSYNNFLTIQKSIIFAKKSKKTRKMTPNQVLENILKELIKEKGMAYVELKCKEYKAKDAQDRYRLKRKLLKFLKA